MEKWKQMKELKQLRRTRNNITTKELRTHKKKE